ncbi:MAG: hypothetical protein M1829_005846 [Trizodia sp. TS-e1964]|nr:MAG: hypothetical protein M1829_005846 [Trizodia sp. TS-e1964]
MLSIFSAACLALPLLSSLTLATTPLEATRPPGKYAAGPSAHYPNPKPLDDLRAILDGLNYGAELCNLAPRSRSTPDPYPGPYLVWVFQSTAQTQQQEGYILIPIFGPNYWNDLPSYTTFVYTSRGKQIMPMQQFTDTLHDTRTFWPAFYVSSYQVFEAAVAQVPTVSSGRAIPEDDWYRAVWAAYAKDNPMARLDMIIDPVVGFEY